VARCRSFSEAAEIQTSSQSSVSQAVAQPEKRLEVRRINLQHRPLQLTPVGQQYFSGCGTLLVEFRDLEDSIQRFSKKAAGHLQVAEIFSIGLQHFRSCAAKLRARSPNTEAQAEPQY